MMQSIMLNIGASQLKSISSLPRDYVKLSKEAENKGEVIFLKRNTPYVVLVDFSRWEMLKEKEMLYDAQEAISSINQSEKEYQAGKSRRFTSFSDL